MQQNIIKYEITSVAFTKLAQEEEIAANITTKRAHNIRKKLFQSTMNDHLTKNHNACAGFQVPFPLKVLITTQCIVVF